MENKSLIYKEENEQIIERRNSIPEKKENIIDSVPSNYIPIELKSCGKLSLPKIIHIKDYNAEDIMKLNISNGNNDAFLKALLGIIKKNIYEEIDIMKIHEKELEEIMLTLCNNFWNKTVEKVYPIDKEEYELLSPQQKESLENEEGIKTITIPISKINLEYINQNFSEPIKIVNGNNTIMLRLSRAGDTLLASEYVDDLYYKEEKQFEKLKEIMEYNKNTKNDSVKKDILPSELKKYQELMRNKAVTFLEAIQAYTIVSYNGKDITTLEEAMKISVPQKVWNQYNLFVEEKCTFGVSGEIEIVSPYINKKYSRRFHFQFLDFLPNDEYEKDEGISISFGN